MSDREELESLSAELLDGCDVEGLLDDLEARGIDVKFKTVEFLPGADPEEIATPRSIWERIKDGPATHRLPFGLLLESVLEDPTGQRPDGSRETTWPI